MSSVIVIGYEECPDCHGKGYHRDDRDCTTDCVRCWASGRIEVYGTAPKPPSTLDEMKARLAVIDAERTALFEQKAPIDAKLVALYKERDKLKEEHDKLAFASGEIDWKQAVGDVAHDGRSSLVLLDLVHKKLSDTWDMYHSGYWNDTMEGNFQVKVERTDESERKSIAGVRFFAPVLKPHEDGYVWFGVFEHSLSRYETLCLKVKPDLSDIRLEALRSTHQALKATFKTVEEAIKYIREHHWYGDRGEDDEID